MKRTYFLFIDQTLFVRRRRRVLENERCGFPLTVGVLFTVLWRLVKRVFKDIKLEIKLRY
jgi:hypothetical protein